jgi:hypothetical protein
VGFGRTLLRRLDSPDLLRESGLADFGLVIELIPSHRGGGQPWCFREVKDRRSAVHFLGIICISSRHLARGRSAVHFLGIICISEVVGIGMEKKKRSYESYGALSSLTEPLGP